MIKPETRCFHCDNLLCAWMQSREPVDGWKAVPTEVKSGRNYLPSYIVFDCPEFRRRLKYANEAEWKHLRKRKLPSIYAELAEICKECEALDYAARGRIRSAVLTIQSLHEKQCADYESRIAELRTALALQRGETNEKLPAAEE